jgi:hypothetical protein
MGGFAKVDNGFGHEKWIQGGSIGFEFARVEEREDKGGVRVEFININDMYNNDVGKGGVYVYKAYEVK